MAHKLGDGIFGLEHPFSEYGTTQGATDWLMDYGGGRTKLPYLHWQQIHDPKIRMYIFQDDEEGEMKFKKLTEGQIAKIYMSCHYALMERKMNEGFNRYTQMYIGSSFSYEQLHINMIKHIEVKGWRKILEGTAISNTYEAIILIVTTLNKKIKVSMMFENLITTDILDIKYKNPSKQIIGDAITNYQINFDRFRTDGSKYIVKFSFENKVDRSLYTSLFKKYYYVGYLEGGFYKDKHSNDNYNNPNSKYYKFYEKDSRKEIQNELNKEWEVIKEIQSSGNKLDINLYNNIKINTNEFKFFKEKYN